MSNPFCIPAVYSDFFELLLAVGLPMSRGFGVEESGVLARGHSRSASHGGVGGSLSAAVSMGVVGRPALKHRGHQRAFSQGMIETSSSFIRGHSRVGSKTDFILPPGHREDSVSAITQRRSGHSRQASRSESVYTLRNNAPPPKWQQMLCSWFNFSRDEEEPRFRTVVPNHLVPPHLPPKLHPNGNRCDNRIRTTKYTLLSFLPKNLLEQFHRVANLYFIFIVLLNWFPSINAFGKEIAMIPVMFVLGVTGIKDLFEDRRRHASDKRINNSFCRVYVSGEERYKKILWKEIRVGDIVHLSNNEFIPADILLLRSSDPQGLCYIDTCNLDGETNLKPRQVARGFVEKQDEFNPMLFRSVIDVDAPTTKIYRFYGAIVHPSGERVPVGTENLLLRDCVLKNTDFVEGIVVYAGHETKAMLNNNGPRYKRSNLEKRMNDDIMWCVVILLVFCTLGAVGSWLHLSSYPQDTRILFLPFSGTPNYEGFLTFWTFIIILQVMIPLSLYVTVEMAKLLQVYHINHSVDLYDSETNKRVECRALNITEELGQVQYIFSDKTGTLTENKMLFRRCTVNGVDYNHPPSENQQNLATFNSSSGTITLNSNIIGELSRGSITGERLQEFLLVLALCNTVIVANHPHYDSMNESGVIQPISKPQPLRSNSEEQPLQVDFVPNSSSVPSNNSRYRRLTESRSITPSPTPLMNDVVENGPPVVCGTMLSPISSSPDSSPAVGSRKTQLKSKLLNVPVPNILSSVVSRKQKNGIAAKTAGNKKPPKQKPIFEAESPDELALVETAYAYNIQLINRTPTTATVNILGESTVMYEVLNVLPFDASRKCMSVILKHPQSGKIIMYSKGADSSMLSKLSPITDLPSQQLLFKTQQHLNSYARLGLRVLVMASRALTEDEYSDWLKKLQEAETSNDIREKKLTEVYNDIERDFTLIGATGIEDRLQSGVPDTILSLRAAGIVVWVITGDKPETAINIAYSARLFTPNMELLKLLSHSKDAAESTINFYLKNINRKNEDGVNSINSNLVAANTSNADRVPRKKALVIDGKTLTYVLDRRCNLQSSFLELTRHCTSVLACRTTPLQKAYLVRMVKEQLKMRTLSVGDGANDVPMIQTADVGIGISGQEGMQACMASDFTMPRFKYLEQLLLVHGHWAYDRLAHMVLYFFYKNATFVFLIFWYQFYCGFSGTVMIDQMYHMLYNLVFTSLPPLTIGVYDQDVPQHLLLTRPSLYRKGLLDLAYRRNSFWIATADAFYQSIIILFVAAEVYTDTDAGIWEFGTTIVTSCMFAMLFQAALDTRAWTILQIGSIIVSLGGYFLFCLLYNSICMQCIGLPSNTWVIRTTLVSTQFWLIICLCTVSALIPRVTLIVLTNVYCPNDTTRVVMEEQQALEQGDNFLVSWSRSTSTSSIYRTNEVTSRDIPTSAPSNPLTAVG